ncbi:unnamed protein product [Protopolystoma xenopodis]|uniref:Oxysterol-binding protein n=1 Tax=Protopolystoma xenopodis TaxID=117903 RepID=A0A448XFC5_9PLAT|nr:unnamed protein product [Protopolystoma xenopodis]
MNILFLKGHKWSVDVRQLPVRQKSVRPTSIQRPEESRCLWQGVTEALKCNDLKMATDRKRELEERQRVCEKFRAAHRLSFPVKYFIWNGDIWSYRSDLRMREELVS